MFGFGMGVLASQLNSAALRDIPPESAAANGIHQSLGTPLEAWVHTAVTILNGTHEVQRWQLDVASLRGPHGSGRPLWFLYPKQQNARKNHSRE